MCHQFSRLPTAAWLMAIVVLSSANSIPAAIIPFTLQGSAGLGLLPGNEVPAVTGGRGGIAGTRISYDDATRNLSINVVWGSQPGFVDLTGPATQMHIHGPASATQTGPIVLTLHNEPGFNASASSGGFNGTVNVPVANVADLLGGRLYINVHTSANSNGEIRGNLVVVPEPSSFIMLSCLSVAGIGPLRRRLFKVRRAKLLNDTERLK